MSREYEVVPHTKLKTVTAFLVQLEQRVTHMHREMELGYLLEGSLILRTGKQVETISKGEIYLVNQMEPHEFISRGNGALLIAIQISPKLMDDFLTQNVHYRYNGSPNIQKELDSTSFRQIAAMCVELAYCFLSGDENYEFSCFSLCASLICLLHKSLPWEAMDLEDYSAMKQRAKRMVGITNYIDQNFQRKLLLSEIAERENLSMVYLSHFFKDTLGMPFQEYLNRKRFEYACELLFTTKRRIMDISFSSGYSDVRYFNEAFTAQYGCSPKEYRKGTLLQAAQLQELHQNTQRFFREEDTKRLLHPLHVQAREELKLYALTDIY